MLKTGLTTLNESRMRLQVLVDGQVDFIKAFRRSGNLLSRQTP